MTESDVLVPDSHARRLYEAHASYTAALHHKDEAIVDFNSLSTDEKSVWYGVSTVVEEIIDEEVEEVPDSEVLESSIPWYVWLGVSLDVVVIIMLIFFFTR